MEPFALRPTERVHPMARRQAAPPKYPEFSRRFRELILGKTQEEVASEIGCTQSYVGQFARGSSRPSYRLAEEIVRVYNLPREEWMALMGHGPEVEPADEREAIAQRAARIVLDEVQPDTPLIRSALEMLELFQKTAAELEAREAALASPRQIIEEGRRQLEYEFKRPIVAEYQEDAEHATEESARQWLATTRRLLEEGKI